MSEYLKKTFRIKGQIAKMQSMLSNQGFLSKASHDVVELNRKKLEDFKNALDRVMIEVHGFLNKKFCYDDGLEGATADDRILWNVQWMRDLKFTGLNLYDYANIDYLKCEFDQTYFDKIYDQNVTQEELADLCDFIINFK